VAPAPAWRMAISWPWKSSRARLRHPTQQLEIVEVEVAADIDALDIVDADAGECGLEVAVQVMPGPVAEVGAGGDEGILVTAGRVDKGRRIAIGGLAADVVVVAIGALEADVEVKGLGGLGPDGEGFLTGAGLVAARDWMPNAVPGGGETGICRTLPGRPAALAVVALPGGMLS